MDFGKTLVGGVLGAVVGAGAHAGIVMAMDSEASWFPIVTGVLTGLGVRKFNPSVMTSASYMRGAMAALIGLAGIFGGIKASSSLQIQQLKKQQSVMVASSQSKGVVESEEEEEETDAPAAEVAAEPIEPLTIVDTGNNAQANRLRGKDFSVWDFVVLGLGMFLAYELGRGNNALSESNASGNDAPEPAGEPVEPPAEPQPQA